MKKPNFAAMNPVVAEAIKQMMAEQGDKFSLEKINLADLGRRTGISRAKLRRMKEHDLEDVQHALKGRKATTTLLSGYTGILDSLLKAGVVNSVVCLDKLRKSGFTGGKTIVKDYISAHYLVPAPRHAVESQGNRGRRYSTGPGEAFQMDWGFTKVQAYSSDMAYLLTTHNVTWAHRDSFCENQYALPEQPEEFPTMPVKTVIKQLPEPVRDLSFEKFNFSKEDG